METDPAGVLADRLQMTFLDWLIALQGLSIASPTNLHFTVNNNEKFCF